MLGKQTILWQKKEQLRKESKKVGLLRIREQWAGLGAASFKVERRQGEEEFLEPAPTPTSHSLNSRK